jgi:hypothetical protein
MKRKSKRKSPELVYRDGKPKAVILDIRDYLEMLERLEDFENLRMLLDVRKKPLSSQDLDEFLRTYDPDLLGHC